MEWQFRRENSSVRSRILDSGARCESMDFHIKVVMLHDTFVNVQKKVRISLHTFENSAFGGSEFDTLPRIRNGLAVLSREFKRQIADP